MKDVLLFLLWWGFGFAIIQACFGASVWYLKKKFCYAGWHIMNSGHEKRCIYCQHEIPENVELNPVIEFKSGNYYRWYANCCKEK